MSGLDQDYSDLMRELWGSPGRWNVRESYAGVARNLGVDEETVRNRLKRLKASGFLEGWRLLPNPCLFGRSSVMQHLRFVDPTAKEAAIPRLMRMDGAIVVASLYGTELLVTLYDDSERTASKRLTDVRAQGEPTEWPGMSLPLTKFRMTQTDWQIIRLMLRDAHRSVAEVAAEVKVSVRTVKRRLDNMMAASAIFIVPMINQAKSTGVSYQVIVESEGGRKSEVDMLVTSKIRNLVFKSADSSDSQIFGFSGKNVAEGKELLDWFRTQPFIRSVKISIVEEVEYAFDWLEREASRLAGLN
ncbi:MAG: AsnC family transcriptional regulator [Thaumarchaeota archaeon]|nr:AsnC family transcriptional regulator [Nitrososphaerota archaeon]